MVGNHPACGSIIPTPMPLQDAQSDPRQTPEGPLHMMPSSAQPRTVAFYLPQFHSIPENDEWWGNGFTEWTNVSSALPSFDGHDHPRRPAQLGHYDLSDVRVQHDQASLALGAGLDAFCFYFYWFAGKRLLEKPLDQYLESGPDFPFCISWANENWSRRWDGKDHEILIAQDYNQGSANAVFDSFQPYLEDARYLKIDGASVLVVHRADHLPAPAEYAATWRELAMARGLGPLYLIAAETRPGLDPRQIGFDATCEFPPVGSNTLGAAQLLPPRGINPAFRGRLMSYPRMARRFIRRRQPGFVRHRGVVPSWDNTARRGDQATVYLGSSPAAYARWLSAARKSEYDRHGSNGLVFVNAWNEWAEGAYLEPDATHGDAFLRATKPGYTTGIGSPARVPIGWPSTAWLHSVVQATAGSVVALLRRIRALARRGLRRG